MTTISDRIFDGARKGVGERLLMFATDPRAAVTMPPGLVGPSPIEVPLAKSTGAFTTPDLEPGPYKVRILWSKTETPKYYDIIVPATGENIPLFPLIESYLKVPPETPAARIAGAVATYLDENPPAGGGDLTKAVADQTYATLEAAAGLSQVVDTKVSKTVADASYASQSAVAGKLDASKVVISDTEPLSPTVGTIWFGPYVGGGGGNARPSTPGAVTLTPGNARVSVAWTASTDADGTIANYRVYRDGAPLAEPTAAPYVDTTVTNGTAYSYRVAAIDNTGAESLLSPAQTVTPQVTIDTVADLVAYWNADTLGADGTSVVSFAPSAGTWGTPLAAPAAGPVVKANAVNGHKALAFTGAASQYMELDHPDLAGPTTMFLVCDLRTAGSAGGRAVASMTSTSFRSIRLASNNTSGGMLTSGSAPNSIYDTWTNTSGWRVVAAVFDGTSSRFYRHKLTPTTGETKLGVEADLRLGRGPATSTEYSDIDVATFGIVNRACTDAEVKAILNSLAAKYAQTLGA